MVHWFSVLVGVVCLVALLAGTHITAARPEYDVSPVPTPFVCPPMKWCVDPVIIGGWTECWWNGSEWVIADYVRDPWLFRCTGRLVSPVPTPGLRPQELGQSASQSTSIAVQPKEREAESALPAWILEIWSTQSYRIEH